ncbi:PhzF family phenazine biosynthesis protein [Halomonas sp. KO116]|uniref:PhzF family phenazine biosynthesis protein n=1 Tax=Halomonas sp. KO116 TaxID=1504981 RepID=UPI0004E4701B|nr:PhzF family phenazine biosynthesis protein [Halomonas sp. KO116]AJY50645.1 phenazine biosynthesis protein PhzF family [Halomonas sp. KO116]
MRRRFKQIDVFGEHRYTGNPVAVVLDAEGLSTEDMQNFTRWMHLSECAFLLPPRSDEADYRVRIFTLTHELPFAGHPTLGTCHAWLEAGGKPKLRDRIIQECGAGLVPIRSDGGLAFSAPSLLRSGEVEESFVEELATVLGINRNEFVDVQWVDNGPGWVGILLASADAVLSIEPDFSRRSGNGNLDIGLVGPYPEGSECAFEVRAIFSDEHGQKTEDPVTGSLNASLAEWLITSGRVKAPYVSSQGTRLGRKGRPRINRDTDGTIWVGGDTFTCINGEVEI